MNARRLDPLGADEQRTHRAAVRGPCGSQRVQAAGLRRGVVIEHERMGEAPGLCRREATIHGPGESEPLAAHHDLHARPEACRG